MTATTVYYGGTILTLDGSPGTAEAVTIRGGRIVGVGERREMFECAGANAAHVDVGGATIMPGLVDTHPHVLHFGGLTHHLVDLSDATSHDDIVARVRAAAEKAAEGTWIQCTPVGEPHYFIRRSWRDLREGCLPDRRVLDRATDRHPVLIQSWAPVIPNVCAMNSAALTALELSRETPDRVENVRIEKDGHGEPTGILRGSVNNYYTNDPFMNSLMNRVPLFEPESVFAGTREAMDEYNRMGVTTAYEGHAMGALEIEVYKALHAQGALSLRVLTSLEAESYGLPWTQPLSDEAFDANLELALSMTTVTDDLFRSNGVTLSRGGPCWPGFIRMNEPYTGPYGEKTRGVTFVSGEKEERTIAFCAERGLRLNFIGAGDRDHDDFLARAEAAASANPHIRERCWILQHAYLMSEEHCRRYAALGFDVTTSISFSWGKGDMLAERIGEHVWGDLIPLARLRKHGMTVACGSDWGPKNIFEQIALAETHEFCGSGHRNLGPGQPVSREESLRMWTADAATVLQWEGIGSIAPGHHADLIVVDRNPAECPNEDLAATKVMRTLLGGDVVHDDGSL